MTARVHGKTTTRKREKQNAGPQPPTQPFLTFFLQTTPKHKAKELHVPHEESSHTYDVKFYH
jgi:hypothetical protein